MGYYLQALSPMLDQQGFPAQFIVEQARSGVQDIRQQWGDWCNVNGAGFGVRPTSSTGDELADAFVWVKPGGESDGTSDTSATRYDSFCGHSDGKFYIEACCVWALAVANPEIQPSSRLLRLEHGTRPSKSSSSPLPSINLANNGCSFEMLVKNAKPAF